MHSGAKVYTFFALRPMIQNHYTWTSPSIFLILTDIGDEGLKLIMSFTRSKILVRNEMAFVYILQNL